MPTLLHIDSSPLYGTSVSRQLTHAFVDQWEAAHPDGTVIDRDLNSTQIPPITAEWVGAAYTPEEARTPEQKNLLAVDDGSDRMSGLPLVNECVGQLARHGRAVKGAGVDVKKSGHGGISYATVDV